MFYVLKNVLARLETNNLTQLETDLDLLLRISAIFDVDGCLAMGLLWKVNKFLYSRSFQRI